MIYELTDELMWKIDRAKRAIADLQEAGVDVEATITYNDGHATVIEEFSPQESNH